MHCLVLPFVNYIVKNSASFKIVDDNPALNPGPQALGHVLTRNIEDLEDCDVVIITGSTVIENSIEKPLKIAKNADFKIIIGPTASWLPDVAFQMGADAVSGMRFKEPKKAFIVIMEGGGTRDFSKHAEKYTITKDEIIE